MDAAAVRAEMERVFLFKRFVQSQSLKQLLRFLVEHAIAGGPPLEESALAAEVFGRPANFVAELDPVVRVQYRRLRSALEAFYDAEGHTSPVVLGTLDEGYGIAVLDRESQEAAHRRRKPRLLMALVALAGVAACAGLWVLYQSHLAGPREAAKLNLQARSLRAKGTLSDIETSEGLFEQAVALNKDSAPAWSGLADALVVPGAVATMSRRDALAKAGEAAAQAIKLDPGIAEAHAAMAYVKVFQDFDFAGGEAEFRKAIQLDPSTPRIHRMYAQALMSRGRFDESIAQTKLAIGLDPPGSPPSTDLAEILCAEHRFDEATAEARRVLQLAPSDPSAHLTLGICLSAAGHYDEAISELQAALLTGRSLYAMARLGYAYGAKGDRIAAESILQRLGQAFAQMVTVNWSYRALVYAGMGDKQNTLACLENGLANHEGDINFIGVEPAYDKLHDDPRFVALQKHVGAS
jgi:tetratricopeptide (TPR) repeat protein